MIAFLFSPLGKAIALAVTILAIVVSIYAKGRSDAGKSAELDAAHEAQKAIERAIDARAAADRDAASDGVRNDEWDRK